MMVLPWWSNQKKYLHLPMRRSARRRTIEPGKKLDPEEDIDLAPPALVNLVSSRQV